MREMLRIKAGVWRSLASAFDWGSNHQANILFISFYTACFFAVSPRVSCVTAAGRIFTIPCRDGSHGMEATGEFSKRGSTWK